jgi:hypothetical protein
MDQHQDGEAFELPSRINVEHIEGGVWEKKINLPSMLLV